MVNPELWYEVLKAWLVYAGQFKIVTVLETVLVFWIIMQMLPDTWAGGKLFNQKFAWITSAIAAVLLFILLVVPIISWQLFVGLLAVALFAGLAILLYRRSHRTIRRKK